jgi:hypothetical protein
MSDIAQQDIAYQPAAKNNSSSAAPTPPSIPQSTLLALGITGLVVVFVVFLLILNYFKIISLPNLLSKTTTTAPVNTNVVNNNQNSTPVSFTKLQNQASDTQMKKYQAFAAGFSKPTAQEKSTDYVSDAILSGYDSQTIQVVTNEGVLNLNFDQNTLFQKYPDPQDQANNATASGMLPKPIKYAQGDFFKNVTFGSILQVFFSKPNLKATQVNYIESIKPIL